MIPVIIFILTEKCSSQPGAKTGVQSGKLLRYGVHLIFSALMIISLSFNPLSSTSQTHALKYKIVQGGDDIGWLRLEKNIVGNKSTLLLISEIKTRMVLLITVSSKELSTFENGKMIFSSMLRKTNGNIKLDKQTRLVGLKYEVLENGGKKILTIPFIGANLLSLYFHEPTGIHSVYSDKHQCFIKVLKMPDGGYKVTLPDGNTNSFYYAEGNCTKIKISHTFFSAEIILQP